MWFLVIGQPQGAVDNAGYRRFVSADVLSPSDITSPETLFYRVSAKPIITAADFRQNALLPRLFSFPLRERKRLQNDAFEFAVRIHRNALEYQVCSAPGTALNKSCDFGFASSIRLTLFYVVNSCEALFARPAEALECLMSVSNDNLCLP